MTDTHFRALEQASHSIQYMRKGNHSGEDEGEADRMTHTDTVNGLRIAQERVTGGCWLALALRA